MFPFRSVILLMAWKANSLAKDINVDAFIQFNGFKYSPVPNL